VVDPAAVALVAVGVGDVSPRDGSDDNPAHKTAYGRSKPKVDLPLADATLAEGDKSILKAPSSRIDEEVGIEGYGSG
jgi:hypothetical protein